MKNQIIHLLFVVLLMFGATSCADSNDSLVGAAKQEQTLRFYLKVPTENMVQTRGYTEADTYKIDTDLISVLLFENGTYYRNCKIEEIKSVPSKENNEYALKIDIPHNNKTVDFVVIVNHDISGLGLKPSETTKEDFYQSLTFNVKGSWKNKLIPMWGENSKMVLTEDLGTRYASEKLQIEMLRAVARIDLSYDISRNFEVKKAYIYHSLSNGQVAPKAANVKHEATSIRVSKPSLPLNPKYNRNEGNVTDNAKDAQDSPIELDYEEGKTILTFLPEQIALSNDLFRPTLVVGIHNKKALQKDEMTFYKINLDIKEEGERKAVDLLRNHKYIITINEVTGLGYPTKEDALKGEATNIEIEMVQWDENINQGYVFGSKYFGMETTDLYFETSEADKTLSFQYQSNIADITSGISIRWEKGGERFNANIVKKDGKQLVEITTKTVNNTADILRDKLIINAVGHQFEVNVAQNTAKAPYRIVCESTQVVGVFNMNLTNPNNYIEVEISVDQKYFDIVSEKRLEIKTETIEGISFFGEDRLPKKLMVNHPESATYRQKVKMYMKGQTALRSQKKFSIIPNSTIPSDCTATVSMVYRRKKVVMLSNGTGFGYAMDKGWTQDTRLYEGAYGMRADSKVKMPPFLDNGTYTKLKNSKNLADREKALQYSYGNYMGNTANDDNLRTELSSTDILIIGYNFSITVKKAKIIADFLVHQKGVALIMNEDNGDVRNLFNAIYTELAVQSGGTAKVLDIKSLDGGGSGTIYPIVTQPGDPIFEGPFNINGQRVKYWGEDATTTRTVVGMPEEDIVVYSRSIFAGREDERIDQGLTMFRHLKVNLFFSGDGGFISNNGGNSGTICPYWVIDAAKGNYLPTYKPEYGNIYSKEGRTEVGNAIIINNALAWAIDKAEFEGSKAPGEELNF